MLGALVSAGAAVLSGLGVVAAPYGSSSWLRGLPGGLIGCDGPTVTLALGTTAGSALTAAAAGRGAVLSVALGAALAFALPDRARHPRHAPLRASPDAGRRRAQRPRDDHPPTTSPSTAPTTTTRSGTVRAVALAGLSSCTGSAGNAAPSVRHASLSVGSSPSSGSTEAARSEPRGTGVGRPNAARAACWRFSRSAGLMYVSTCLRLGGQVIADVDSEHHSSTPNTRCFADTDGAGAGTGAGAGADAAGSASSSLPPEAQTAGRPSCGPGRTRGAGAGRGTATLLASATTTAALVAVAVGATLAAGVVVALTVAVALGLTVGLTVVLGAGAAGRRRRRRRVRAPAPRDAHPLFAHPVEPHAPPCHDPERAAEAHRAERVPRRRREPPRPAARAFVRPAPHVRRRGDLAPPAPSSRTAAARTSRGDCCAIDGGGIAAREGTAGASSCGFAATVG